MATTFVLADSPRMRYLTGALMYFAQGIPYGLLAIAIPAWLASQGVGAGAIGSYLAVIVLPWAFKLVTGPFMDRFQLPAMGARRPWVLGAQLGLTISLLGLMFIRNPAEQMGLLMLVGVIINSFAATQDVAVDGMAIDLTPVNEQGRLNAFMTAGKAAGWSITASVSGLLLVNFGVEVTAIVASAVAGAIFLYGIVVLEREGEQRFPWGRAKRVFRSKVSELSFGAVFRGIGSAMWQKAALVVLLIMFFDGLVTGYGQALMPVAAVNLFGYTTDQWSNLVAMMGLVGAGISLGLGPLIDRFGAKSMLMLNISLLAVHAFLIAQTQHLWVDSTYVRVMLSIWVMMLPVVMVCSLALAMAVCSSKLSATQFAIFMSAANLGHAAGAKLFGMMAENSPFDVIYMVLGSLVVVMMVVLVAYRQREDARDEAKKRRGKRAHGLAAAGSRSGVFWSGAMRCPKCRADMEIVEVEGQEVDRCLECHGLWFDAGEMEILAHGSAAAALDTGTSREGRLYNVIEDYRCPRCGGHMERKVDPRQTHIWYETCGDCAGSFFDAGEFRDLAEHSVTDFFKSLVTPRRL
jgi:PAT family beta-lactamase induction signal transducer AmpG